MLNVWIIKLPYTTQQPMVPWKRFKVLVSHGAKLDMLT